MFFLPIKTNAKGTSPSPLRNHSVTLSVTARFKANAKHPTEGPYGLSKAQLRALSLTEKQALFAKLPLLKYQGKLLNGSEFLNLIYHFPYPEKKPWVFSPGVMSEPGADTLIVMLSGLMTLGFIPAMMTGIANQEGYIPILPQKGIAPEAFQNLCRQFLTVKEKPVNPSRLIQLLNALELIYSYYEPPFLTPSRDNPVTFTRSAKRLIKNPIKTLTTLSVFNNHTFAQLLEN